MAVEPTAVAKFLDRSDDPSVVALAEAHLPVVTAFIEAYTRGNGFTNGEPADSIAAVIIAATARLVSNPAMTVRETDGDYDVVHPRLDGFTLPELAVLHLFRRRTA